MRAFIVLFSVMGIIARNVFAENVCDNKPYSNPSNSCTTFTVSSGTGCAWICNYCASQLGTNNYYFTDGVCTYQQGVGCVGNPVAGQSYTCCQA